MDDTKRQQLVRWWVEPLMQGLEGAKPLSHDKLADKYSAKYKETIDRRTVANAIRDAFKMRLVELREQLVVPTSEREAALEDMIKAKYHLDFSIVVRSADPTINSDQLHSQLGYHAAQFSAGHFRPHDIIGVGSGRAVHYFVDSFRNFTKLNARGITLMSLTGTVYPEQTITLPDQLIDADINTVTFAKCFSQTTLVRTISYPIALLDVVPAWRNTWLYDPTEDDQLKGKERDSFAANNFSAHVPSLAFVGVGVLAPNHRLYRETVRGASSTMLNPIRENLRSLISIADRVSLRYGERNKDGPPYHPVADICHRLWFVEPPDGFNLNHNERMQMIDLIDKLNDHMLTVKRRQLRRVKNVVLIAGTEEKSLAIRRLLEENAPGKSEINGIIKTLCTDSATARWLLDR